MSLVDHFKAPILNIGALVSILLIALLFGVFRLSGGYIAISTGSSAGVNSSGWQEPLEVEAPPVRRDSFESQRPVVPSRERGADADGLDDIESALGLR